MGKNIGRKAHGSNTWNASEGKVCVVLYPECKLNKELLKQSYLRREAAGKPEQSCWMCAWGEKLKIPCCMWGSWALLCVAGSQSDKHGSSSARGWRTKAAVLWHPWWLRQMGRGWRTVCWDILLLPWIRSSPLHLVMIGSHCRLWARTLHSSLDWLWNGL